MRESVFWTSSARASMPVCGQTQQNWQLLGLISFGAVMGARGGQPWLCQDGHFDHAAVPGSIFSSQKRCASRGNRYDTWSGGGGVEVWRRGGLLGACKRVSSGGALSAECAV